MSAELLLSLAGLALIDSTSIGTLFIPIWLMLVSVPLRPGRLLGYLATVAGFYFVVGILLVLGATPLADAVGGSLDHPVALWIQLGIGVGLFALSFRFDSKRQRKRGSGPVARWQERVMSGSGSPGWLVGLALIAAVAEVATMLPYLGAIGMMTTSDLDGTLVPVLLAGYCAVMVLPALVLLALRTAARERVEPLLRRMSKWMERHAASATGWVLGIAGFLVARDAVFRLFSN
ncbi:GAP family protein [Phytohabitans kaempferiae]|uniref:GAP family protein n=1 Tax=Phytohabitans kaempferiae TaxID=1620943 RepID=A0ABV6LYR8_9ACTN